MWDLPLGKEREAAKLAEIERIEEATRDGVKFLDAESVNMRANSSNRLSGIPIGRQVSTSSKFPRVVIDDTIEEVDGDSERDDSVLLRNSVEKEAEEK